LTSFTSVDLSPVNKVLLFQFSPILFVFFSDIRIRKAKTQAWLASEAAQTTSLFEKTKLN